MNPLAEFPFFAFPKSGQALQFDQGVLRAFTDPPSGAGDVTLTMKDFYEVCCFPNYDTGESIATLLKKSRARSIANDLDRSIPPHASVLEVGCGTGQLGTFLSLSRRKVVSVDMSMNSLREAQAFKVNHGLDDVLFCQMNLFHMPLAESAFDFVICTGVLHHTHDPKKGFEVILRHLKPGGYIIIGLYNTIARMKTRLRRPIRSFGFLFDQLDPYLREFKPTGTKREAWISDQYHNPHESSHTIDEVMNWFEESGIDFIRCVPSTDFLSTGRLDYKHTLLEPESPGTRFGRWMAQLRQAMWDKEGGLFLMIGRKPLV